MIIKLLKDYQTYKAGQSYEIEDQATADLMIAAGYAEKVDKTVVEVKQTSEAELTAKVEQAMEKAFTSIASKGVNIHVPKNEPNFKSAGDFLQSVAKSTINRRIDDKLDKALGANETTDADGGYTVPIEYARTLMDNIRTESQLFNQCKQLQMGSNNLYIPALNDATRTATTSGYTGRGGATVYTIGEGETIPVTKLAYGRITLAPHKNVCMVPVTSELIEDSVDNVASTIETCVVENLAEYMDLQVLFGNGNPQMTGIVGHTSSVEVARAATGAVSDDDLLNMYASIWSRSINRGVWIINNSVLSSMMSMTIGDMPVFVPAGGLGGAPYSTLFGRPIIVSQFAEDKGTKGDVVFADLSQYLVGIRRSLDVASSIHVAFATDEQHFRFTMRVDGKPGWLDAFTQLNGGAVSPFVVLADKA
ncbi:MAG: phage major capsid protein [Armatimonadota bacterium]